MIAGRAAWVASTHRCVGQGCAAIALLVILVLDAQAGFAAGIFKGKVVYVVDGDTIIVLQDERQVRVRPASIDRPERGQAFGRQAKYATTALAVGKRVTVVVDGRDRNGRILGEVLLPDGVSLNRELVRTGWAWHYRQYSKDLRLAELEAEAGTAGRGLWADAHPVAPWDYRKQRSAKSRASSERRAVAPR
jgi:endonuclease YncB( thermonuclease family)